MFSRTCFVLVVVFLIDGSNCDISFLVAASQNVNYTVPSISKPIYIPACSVGDKNYYLGIFFKANYFQASEFCRYHGMELASIESQYHQNVLLEYIRSMGYINEYMWTSGNDLGQEGRFVWASTGQPLTYKNFLPNQPDNASGKEHCLELRHGGLWNDSVCDIKQFFICQFN